MPSAPKKVFFHIKMYDNTNISFLKQIFRINNTEFFPLPQAFPFRHGMHFSS